MSRAIKFRVWDNEKGEYRWPPESVDSSFGKDFLTLTLDGRLYIEGMYQRVTLEQFTDCKDDDSGDVYHGDIVKFTAPAMGSNPEMTITGAVDWCPHDLTWVVLDRSWTHELSSMPGSDVGYFRVIGNVHENPDLL